MRWEPTFDAARDATVLLVSAAGAQIALTGGSIAEAARDAASDLAVYVVLAMVGAIWRAAWNARDGKLPKPGLILRSLLIALGVGLVGGLWMIDLDWSPFTKMALIILLSFGADWSIPAAQAALRGWLARLAGPPQPSTIQNPPRRRPADEPSEGG